MPRAKAPSRKENTSIIKTPVGADLIRDDLMNPNRGLDPLLQNISSICFRVSGSVLNPR